MVRKLRRQELNSPVIHRAGLSICGRQHTTTGGRDHFGLKRKPPAKPVRFVRLHGHGAGCHVVLSGATFLLWPGGSRLWPGITKAAGDLRGLVIGGLNFVSAGIAEKGGIGHRSGRRWQLVDFVQGDRAQHHGSDHAGGEDDQGWIAAAELPASTVFTHDQQRVFLG